MTRVHTTLDFAREYAALLPATDAIAQQPSEYWGQLGVRAERVIAEATDGDAVVTLLERRVGLPILQGLCLWVGLPAEQSLRDCSASLAQYVVANLQAPHVHELLMLLEFVRGRRFNSTETMSKALLEPEPARVVSGGQLGDKSGKFAYAMLVYGHNAASLRLLMLFEESERVAYRRHLLVVKRDDGDRAVPVERVEAARVRIEQGVDLTRLRPQTVDEVLAEFEAQRSNSRRSRCVEIHRAARGGAITIFILRQLREASIREVERTVFGDEAELVVLRCEDGMRSVEEHSVEGVGAQIAEAIAERMLGTQDVEFIADEARTPEDRVRTLVDSLRLGADDTLWLRELDLTHAPVDGNPRLILRCDKRVNLVRPLESFEAHDLDLGTNLDDIGLLGVVAERRLPDEAPQSYIMRLTLDRVAVPGGGFVVRYSQQGTGAPTDFRRHFERDLKERYGVNAIPTAG